MEAEGQGLRGWITTYEVYDAYQTYEQVVKDFPEMTQKVEEVARKLQEVEKRVEEARQEARQLIDEVKNQTPQQIVTNVMSAAAKLNDCIRARRCILVHYGDTHYHAASKQDCSDLGDPGELLPGPHTGKGCCPGQSGHHVLPAEMFKDCPAYKKKVKTKSGYGCAHQMAPTVCAEGVNQHQGSHGVVHKKLSIVLGNLEKNGKTVPWGGEITKNDAIAAGVKSVQEAFPESSCNAKCLEAQLRSFYSSLNCTPKKASGLPEPPESETENNESSK